jgi:diamine N-acetyltransferase
MSRSSAPTLAFEARSHAIAEGVALVPVTPAMAAVLAPQIAAMDPWLTLDIDAARVQRSLTGSSVHDGSQCFALLAEGEPAGAIEVVPRWLVGPYLRHLSVLPSTQGRGLGRAAMGWMEAQARQAGARNLWVCASAFNARALEFYQSCGFTEAALLADLLRDGQHERLLRKRLEGR